MSSTWFARSRQWDPARTVRLTFLCVVMPLFSVFYLWQALEVPSPARPLAVKPSTFPVVIGVVLVACSLAIAAVELHKTLRSRRSAREPAAAVPQAVVTESVTESIVSEAAEASAVPDEIGSGRDALVVLALVAGYVLTFDSLGFVVSTVAFQFLLSTYFSPSQWLRNGILAVFLALGLWYLFDSVFAVSLPDGVIPLSGVR